MKVVISRKTLMNALEKGGAPALSDEAQADNCSLSYLIKSVKITVDKNLVIESGTNLICVKHTVPINDETGIIVKEAGCVLVPAKELMNFLSVQGEDAVIGLSFQKYATPEVVSVDAVSSDMGSDQDGDKKLDQDGDKKLEIKKVGQLKLSSKSSANASKTSGKWELDCYDIDRFPNVNFSAKSEKNFEINGERMIEGLNTVIFASMSKDYDRVLDSASIQIYKDDLYFVTTDSTRCAVYKMPKADVKEISSTKQLLIPCSLLDQVSKIIDKAESLSFSYSEEINRVFVSQPHLKIRLACTDKDKIIGFPSLEKLLIKEYRNLTEMPKNTLNELLVNAALVNNSSALFTFSKKDGTVLVKAISEDGKYKPSFKQATVSDVSKDVGVIWSVKKLIEGMKVVKSDNVKLSVPDNLKSVKVVASDNDSFSYFCMSIENSKYDTEIKA